ncbi:DUF5053 domain-containing protein [Bacteroides salyersiae]|uniref:DUF5053 domain-containing protein n=1 Tax=Bacteroides salyersiae TaxID=291644 RepID=UPI001B8C8FF5|nr:DUF5053 domain-containing protein [Bacteroides salyersiae]MBT9871986.1 DUF5053 domain-containing protein [Bacteroides salyersiae]MCS2404447.1 DUF5053 domain-containing protein [Bacteroides salyersiae]QUT76170.1 protein of unknown function (DUF5053) [Bacteroides salyersiae]
MKTDIEKLKERFVNADSEKEMEAIDKEMKALADKDIEMFSEGMLECIKETNKKADELLLREKLESVLPFISVSALVKTYFKKSPQWFYHRLNGSIVNGKPARFNDDELKILSNALVDIGKKISQAAAFVF